MTFNGTFMHLIGEAVSIRSFSGRLVIFFTLWFTLVGGTMASTWSSVWLGLPTVVLVTILSLKFFPKHAISFSGLLPFARYFLVSSVKGALDVSYRAMHPKLPIEPKLINYPFIQKSDGHTTIFINAISLLPGTLSAKLEEDCIIVHVLTHNPDITSDMNTLEQLVDRLFKNRRRQ